MDERRSDGNGSGQTDDLSKKVNIYKDTTSTKKIPNPQSLPQSPAVRWTPFRKGLALFVAIVSFIATIMSLVPRVSVDLTASNDPASEFAAIAHVNNIGYFPIYNLHVSFGLCDISTEADNVAARKTISACSGMPIPYIHRDIWEVDRLAPDKKFSISLDDLIKIRQPSKLTNADFAIVIKYRDVFGLSDTKEFGFKSRLRTDGKIDWLGLPRN